MIEEILDARGKNAKLEKVWKGRAGRRDKRGRCTERACRRWAVDKRECMDSHDLDFSPKHMEGEQCVPKACGHGPAGSRALPDA